MRTKCAQAGLHTSDRLLLEAVRKFKAVRSHVLVYGKLLVYMILQQRLQFHWLHGSLWTVDSFKLYISRSDYAIHEVTFPDFGKFQG